jgi:hypothetical protein
MIWLIYDYEDGGVVNISAVDAYFGVELKDRRRRPEGRGEWEPIKILLENLAYIPILDLTFLSSNSVKTAQL